MAKELSDNSEILIRVLSEWLGIDEPTILGGFATLGVFLQNFVQMMARAEAVMAKIDWALLQERLNNLPTKSKEAMLLALSKGWFFGWHDSLREVMEPVEALAVIEPKRVDEFFCNYYRSNLPSLADELIQKYPSRALPIKAAVRAHNEFGADGYSLSVPVFIAQGDGLLREIAGVESPRIETHLAALREKVGTDEKSSALLQPILSVTESDFMKSASDREKSARLSGEPFNALNRHQVMHGECSDYGTETNSLKSFSFLAFIGLHLPLVLESTNARLQREASSLQR